MLQRNRRPGGQSQCSPRKTPRGKSFKPSQGKTGHYERAKHCSESRENNRRSLQNLPKSHECRNWQSQARPLTSKPPNHMGYQRAQAERHGRCQAPPTRTRSTRTWQGHGPWRGACTSADPHFLTEGRKILQFSLDARALRESTFALSADPISQDRNLLA